MRRNPLAHTCFLLQDDRDTSRLHSPDALRTAQTANEVPDNLLLPFLHHVNDAYEMGKEVNQLTFTAEEYISLLSATANGSFRNSGFTNVRIRMKKTAVRQ